MEKVCVDGMDKMFTTICNIITYGFLLKKKSTIYNHFNQKHPIHADERLALILPNKQSSA